MKTSLSIGKALEEVKIHDQPTTNQKMKIKVTYGGWCKVCSVVLAALFLVVAATFTALYFIRHTNDHTKQYECTLHYDNGVQQAERVIVTERDEEFETKDVHLNFDFSTGLSAMSFKNNEDLQDCYVNSFNMSEIPTPETMRNKYPGPKIDVAVGDQVEQNYEVTEIWMNSETLGPKSREICQGKDVYLLKQLTNAKRVKRQDKKDKKKESDTTVSILWGVIKVRVKTKKSN